MPTVFPVAQRGPASEASPLTSNPFPVHIRRVNQVTLTFTGLTDAEYSDPGLSLVFYLDGNDQADGSGPWNAIAQNSWSGGVPSKFGGWTKPDFSFSTAELINTEAIRARLAITKRTAIGLDYTVT
jgi:hypothetical protein